MGHILEEGGLLGQTRKVFLHQIRRALKASDSSEQLRH